MLKFIACILPATAASLENGLCLPGSPHNIASAEVPGEARSSSLLQVPPSKGGMRGDVKLEEAARALNEAGGAPSKAAMRMNAKSEKAAGSVKQNPGDNNLCVAVPHEGYFLAPEFMLIGAEKAGSSSFYEMLNTTGLVMPHNTTEDEAMAAYSDIKELHIFSRDDRFVRGQGFWLHHYPNCTRDRRLVATDCTPSYLHDPRAPERIQQFYGVQAARIKFGVILRNPLNRMHSAFHYWKSGIGRPLCERQFIEVTFEQYVQGVLAGRDPCHLLDLYGSDHPTQLKGYFELFHPSQFMVFLYHQVAKPPGTRVTAIADLWRWLGVPAPAAPMAIEFGNSSHPELDQEITVASKLAIEALIARTISSDHIARILTATKERPQMPEYYGQGDAASISAWIKAGW